MKPKISINYYLEKVGRFCKSDYGKMVRSQFAGSKGEGELAMLVAPTEEELEQMKKTVAIMTPEEKENAENLSDEQVEKIAKDAGVDPAVVSIFINGYALHCKRVS